MADLIYMLDTNNNGFIDYTEFLAGCMKSKIYLNEDNLKIAFSYFDKVYHSYMMMCIGFEWLHHKRRVAKDPAVRGRHQTSGKRGRETNQGG